MPATARFQRLSRRTAAWTHPDQLGSLGGFSGLFRLPGDAKRALVGSTDGVGTKLLVAAALRRYETVAAIWSIIASTTSWSPEPIRCSSWTIWRSASSTRRSPPWWSRASTRPAAPTAARCWAARPAEIAGRLSRGSLRPRRHDRRIVELDAMPDPNRVQPGDAIVGLPAVGLHTNGYTLARAVIAESEYGAPFGRTTYGEALLAPQSLVSRAGPVDSAGRDVKTMAHITGGGLLGERPANASRPTPPRCSSKRVGNVPRSWRRSCVARSSRTRNGIGR